MKASFSSGAETEKIGSGNMPSTKYGFCYTMKKGMAFKCHSPIILRPGAFSWQEY
jgi:hypothetical protein